VTKAGDHVDAGNKELTEARNLRSKARKVVDRRLHLLNSHFASERGLTGSPSVFFPHLWIG